MNKKKIIVICLIVFIILLIVIIKKKTETKNIVQNSTNTIVTKDNKEYVVYDEKTGREIVRVPEDEKYRLKIYEMDPSYQEIEYEEFEAGSYESNDNFVKEY